MSQPEPRPASRRLIWWSAASALVPTLALVGLGIVIVNRDRSLGEQREQADREQAVDIAVAALSRTLAGFEGSLSAVSAAPSAAVRATDSHAAFVMFDANGVIGRAGVSLPHYPAVSTPPASPGESLPAADDLEFTQHNPTSTIRVLLPLARVADPLVRAEAWLRLARNYRKVGDPARALDAFGQLASLDAVVVQGMPAGLMGQLGRALVLEKSGRASDLLRESLQLLADLRAGRWILTSSQYENGVMQASVWSKTTPPVLDSDVAALIAAAESVWRNRPVSADQASGVRGLRTEWTGDQSVLVLTQATPTKTTAMFVPASALHDSWATSLAAMTLNPKIDLALSDADGHPVIGNPTTASTREAVRDSNATKLPWIVHAWSRGGAPRPELSGSTRLMLAGLALMVLVVVAGGYAINRAVSREMRVARLQSDFVAAVSHEFRTPLTTIRQLSEMLARARVSTDDKRQQFYDTILGESERLNRLIEELLDFGRMETGRLEFRQDRVDVAALVDDVAEAVQRDAAASGHRIEIERAPALPAVRGDRDALAHVFRNLFENAVKYSPDHRTVWVRVENGGGRLSVRVRDRGLGIPRSEQREIFQKFVRGAASTASRIAGTGIGLAMARQIVDAHGGAIAVESVPGEGSTFTVTLPAMHS